MFFQEKVKLKNYISIFLNSSTKDLDGISIIASGLYPFLHYYNSNLSLADSLTQCMMLILVCFVVPIALLLSSKILVKHSFLSFFKKSHLSILNISVFFVLLGFLVFQLNKKELLVLVILSSIIGYFLFKYLKKIIIIQLLLAIMSFFTIIPKGWFAIHQNNDDWALISDVMLQTNLNLTPNIFVIQPDGYINFVDFEMSLYNYDNSEFEGWLHEHDFITYDNFRSNYYSTLTSNSSMFAMKHHFYGNTRKSTLKTYNANNVIVGHDNNVLKILKNNQYQTHLFTDNSYFLANRRDLFFDYCNVPLSEIHFFETKVINGIDVITDLSKALDTLSKKRNFFFIEKTIPGHISYSKQKSKGSVQERLNYLSKLKDTNDWLKGLIGEIREFDSDALIVIVADHGGYVGLDYSNEVVNRRLNHKEVISAFSSVLCIKWPKRIDSLNLDFKSNINLFHNIFYALSGDNVFIDNLQPNNSYLPLMKNGSTLIYKCIDEHRNVVFEPIEIFQ